MINSEYNKIIVHKIESINHTNSKDKQTNLNNKKKKDKKNKVNFSEIFNKELDKIT